jgi:hypothetical protein
MKKILLFIIAALLVSCTCHLKPRFTINGVVPSNKYDGNKVYLVPVKGDNPSNVDSTIISNGKFSFEGDTERVSIIRVKPALRFELQDLLVVTEKGTTTVKLDSNSTSTGTQQNEQLQQWKDIVMQSNKDFALFQIAKRKGINGNELKMLEEKAEISNNNKISLTKKIIHTHRKSTLSKFLSNMTGIK